MSYIPPPPPPGPLPPYGGAPSAQPNNYLVWSILTTVFCCLPTGIVAIIKSAKVDSLWTTGQYAAAQQASDEAKKWNIIGVAIAAVIAAAYVLLFVVLGLATDSGY